MAKTVNWLLERDMFEHYSKEFLDAASELGLTIKLTPSIGYGYALDDSRDAINRLFPAGSVVLFHGSIGMAEELRANSFWSNTTYCNWENLECAMYYCHFSSLLLNSDYAMMPFGELRRKREWLFDTFGANDTIFARPNSCQKSFTGQVVQRGSFEADLEIMGFYDVPPNALVVVTTPKTITREWRFIVVDNAVITGCQYKSDGKLNSSTEIPPRVTEWVEEKVLGASWQPDDAWTADICETDDGNLFLLEIGSVTCSDLYVCDKSKFIDAMSRHALQSSDSTR